MWSHTAIVLSRHIDGTFLHVYATTQPLQYLCLLLWPCLCQTLLCLSNAKYMAYMQITSCVDMRQLCQYICLIKTYCNQQCDKDHWYAYQSHYWHMLLKNMSTTVHKCVPLHVFCSHYIDQPLLHTWVNNQEMQLQLHLKCYIFATCSNFSMCIMVEVCQYICYIWTN